MSVSSMSALGGRAVFLGVLQLLCWLRPAPGCGWGLRQVPSVGLCVLGRGAEVGRGGVWRVHGGDGPQWRVTRGVAPLSARGPTLAAGEGWGEGTVEHRPLCPQHPPHPYHTSQCLPGFMGEPRGQRKCSTKSRELLSVPMTRYLSGLWGSVTSPSWELSGVRTEHHTCQSGSSLRDRGQSPPGRMGGCGMAPRGWGGMGNPPSCSALPVQSPQRRAGGW